MALVNECTGIWVSISDVGSLASVLVAKLKKKKKTPLFYRRDDIFFL